MISRRYSYEYDPATKTLTLKMPGRVHEEGVRAITALLDAALRDKHAQLLQTAAVGQEDHNHDDNDDHHIGVSFLAGVRPSGSPDVHLEGGAAKVPDQSFADGCAVQPSVAVLVAATQTWAGAMAEAERYVLGTNGLVRAVVVVKLAPVARDKNTLLPGTEARVALVRARIEGGCFAAVVDFDVVSSAWPGLACSVLSVLLLLLPCSICLRF